MYFPNNIQTISDEGNNVGDAGGHPPGAAGHESRDEEQGEIPQPATPGGENEAGRGVQQQGN